MLVARQQLFDYSIGVAFMFLSQKLQGQHVPDVSKTFNIPIVGSFELQLTDILITDFNCSARSSNLTILGNGFFHLLAGDIGARLTFKWHWTKAGLSGSGDGELLLQGGTIDWVYEVHKDEQLQKPQLVVVTANSQFDSVDLKIHSYSADWLYQAVLTLFNEAVKRQVQNGVQSALDTDVPDRLNQVLGSLPTRLDVRGLPFGAAFEYSLYTAAFVLIKGFAEVELPQPPAPSSTTPAGGLAAGVAAATDAAVKAALGRKAAAEAAQAEATAVQRRRRSRRLAQDQDTVVAGAAAAAAEGGANQMTKCPFEAGPLPIDGDVIAADGRMISIYVHESTANCLLWGLYNSGKLTFSLRDGSVPGLTITTDILALLVPELPTLYPHMKMIINVEALSSPMVSFSAADGTTLTASYRLSLVVANASLGDPEVVRLAANVSVSGAFDWDSSVIGQVEAHHEVEASVLSVPAEQWDNTVVWLLQNYGGLVSLHQAVDMLVKTPIASMVQLANAQATTWDRWYGMSADVQLRLPPPPAPSAARQAQHQAQRQQT
ncbi:hypothetical protein GPECTOR_10g944 [Gonium pectorale]|uniref:Lipid-binding serum glycoprotein C-terminal domain-containing protein n=1 Tax=Gonium pectorale TaxID=33097 RepID=A0A150GRD3_GONPE|nr:hypothetical protein GPECTOR_10g944 [Gonium pectorale]|eukprot:KXZ52312.1 hypothetical protein GPECTOR_10g944 [Gonium pectorale]